VGFYFWVFSSIPLINMSVSVSIPCSFYHYCSVILLDVRDGDSSSHSFIVKNCFCYSGFFFFFCLSRWIWEVLFPCLWRIVLGFWWGLHWIYRLPLVEWPIFTMLILPIHEYGRSLHFLRSSSISFLRNLKFLSYRSFTSLVSGSPRYFILSVASVMRVVSLITGIWDVSMNLLKCEEM